MLLWRVGERSSDQAYTLDHIATSSKIWRTWRFLLHNKTWRLLKFQICFVFSPKFYPVGLLFLFFFQRGPWKRRCQQSCHHRDDGEWQQGFFGVTHLKYSQCAPARFFFLSFFLFHSQKYSVSMVPSSFSSLLGGVEILQPYCVWAGRSHENNLALWVGGRTGWVEGKVLYTCRDKWRSAGSSVITYTPQWVLGENLIWGVSDLVGGREIVEIKIGDLNTAYRKLKYGIAVTWAGRGWSYGI